MEATIHWQEHHGLPPGFERRVPGPAAEAIVNADAHLSDAALTTYSAITEQHADMLAALCALLDAHAANTLYLGGGHWEQARAAIAKATGTGA